MSNDGTNLPKGEGSDFSTLYLEKTCSLPFKDKQKNGLEEKIKV